ncbi:hypothetical protein [Janibacter limosus]|jgi:hypothetical protein|uniref:hypothetical protein n=1 Tax=Janibacter limosus TaxID=53458 RepID=UPI0008365873|nr:hypothetical protein [Janibacter limosus]
MSTTSRRSPVQGMRRGVLVAGLVGTALLTIGGAVTAGEDGALSALAGSLLAFFVVVTGLVAISLIVAGDVGTSMAGAGVVYLGQLIILFAAVAVLREMPWLDGRTAALSAIVSTVVLQAGVVAGYVRGRHLIHPSGASA